MKSPDDKCPDADRKRLHATTAFAGQAQQTMIIVLKLGKKNDDGE